MSDELALPPPSLDEEIISTTSSSSSFVPVESHIQDAIQVINERKEFNNEILEYINTATPSAEVGNNYHIISVFGSQSTGKSTLLNKLFNTNFDVMDETNRQQTTKGIWMAYSPHISSTGAQVTPQKQQLKENVFVMDVEGTDGRERGEDQDFERKAALFALSTSEILIINTWETQIGLYQGANMGLLKTVFEVNLSLFGKSKVNNASNDHKVLLLFVIRDHIGVTPKESLAATVKQDLQKIWESLNKPSEVAHLKFADFFDVGFHTLRHKVLQADKFLEDVSLLGDKLVDPKNPEYLFKPYYHHSIPVDGWTMYAEQCWEQIDNNKDLDLPTQQILVAKFKCDEILNGVYEEFLDKFRGRVLSQEISNEVEVDYKELGLLFTDLQHDTIEDYDISASRYNKNVFEQKRLVLLGKITEKFKEVFDQHMKNLTSSTVKQFKEKLTSKRKRAANASTGSTESFINIVSETKLTSIQEFTQKAKFISLDGKLDFKAFENKLNTKLEEVVSGQQVSELNNFINKALKKLSSGMTKTVAAQLSEPEEHSWDAILGVFHSLVDEPLKKFETVDGKYDFQLGASDELNSITATTFKFKAWTKFYDVVRKYVSKENLLTILKDRFETKFRYDENGLPKLYQNVHELGISFKEAKEYALKVVPFVSFAKLSNSSAILPEFDIFDKKLKRKYNNSNGLSSAATTIEQHESEDEDDDDEEDEENTFSEIINETDKAAVLAKFKRETDAVFVETNRSIVQHITQIPYYIYLIIVLLGWNEFMAVIRNPFTFSLALIFGAGFYVMWTLNLLRPASIVAQKMVDECILLAKEKFREWVVDEHQTHGRNLGKISGGNESEEEIELDDLSRTNSE
ncbi:protein Sey1p [[Candida] anglica]